MRLDDIIALYKDKTSEELKALICGLNNDAVKLKTATYMEEKG